MASPLTSACFGRAGRLLIGAALLAATSVARLETVRAEPAVAQAPTSPRAAAVDPALLKLLEWRLVGPFRGGRSVAVAGDPKNRLVFYFGAAGGGLWKTEDGGHSWRNVSDGFFKAASVGAVAVAPSDPSVIYVGTGESCFRGDAQGGDGIYKSTDGGKTWTHLGLEATRQIARIHIHPQNPDLVYVAAFGDGFGPGLGIRQDDRPALLPVRVRRLGDHAF